METAAAAAAKSLQSCPTLSDPMDCSLFIIQQTNKAKLMQQKIRKKHLSQTVEQ